MDPITNTFGSELPFTKCWDVPAFAEFRKSVQFGTLSETCVAFDALPDELIESAWSFVATCETKKLLPTNSLYVFAIDNNKRAMRVVNVVKVKLGQSGTRMYS